MPARDEITFAFQVAPVGEGPDHELYGQVIEDCKLGQALGFESAWLLEHHFSDYYPTPSPLLHMAHLAAHCPGLGLGTSVLVLPWYHPVRLAEEILMLNAMTEGTLHLGLGRGTAKSEYDGYGVDMNEARGRFAEIWRIVEKAMADEPFSFEGKYYRIPREIRPRPMPTGKPVRFYGAIGSLPSAEIMADLGLPPLCLSGFPDHLLARILETWKARTAERGGDPEATIPLSVKLFIADSDEAARQEARRWFPYYFDLQARHYEVDDTPWDEIPDYQAFKRMFQNLKKLADPANLDPYLDANLIGSPETVTARLEELTALGFNYMMVSAAVPGVPQAVRHEQYGRFAREVAPRFSRSFSQRASDAAD